MMDPATATAPMPGTLPTDDADRYHDWRVRKLSSWPDHAEQLFVTIRNLAQPSRREKEALLQNCTRTGLSFYRTQQQADKTVLKQFWRQLGMRQPISNPCADDEGISTIQVEHDAKYIPYTAKPLGWHTDGYYNTREKTIRAFAMHCISPAAEGGVNAYFDPEILYILLHDENPAYITALAHPNAMTIPQHAAADHEPRPAVTLPALTLEGHKPCMRYTERSRNIAWRDDATLRAALTFIRSRLAPDRPYQLSCKLQAGEGVICNNVLHKRTAFSDPAGTAPRLLYRARFGSRWPDRAPAAS